MTAAECILASYKVAAIQAVLILESIGQLPLNAIPANIYALLLTDTNVVDEQYIVVGLDPRTIMRAPQWFHNQRPKQRLITVVDNISGDVNNPVWTAIMSPDTIKQYAQRRIVINNKSYNATTIPSTSVAVSHDMTASESGSVSTTVGKLIANQGMPDQLTLKERNREIRLLQQCLLELEIEYFRVVAENDMYRQQQEVDEESFIEPWFRKYNKKRKQLDDFDNEMREEYKRNREFQDQIAAKGFQSALQGQNNALVAISGAAVNQRPYNDAMYAWETKRSESDRYDIGRKLDRLGSTNNDIAPQLAKLLETTTKPDSK